MDHWTVEDLLNPWVCRVILGGDFRHLQGTEVSERVELALDLGSFLASYEFLQELRVEPVIILFLFDEITAVDLLDLVVGLREVLAWLDVMLDLGRDHRDAELLAFHE